MAFVPSYKDNEWQVNTRHGQSVIQIRVLENDEWRDYWVPDDPSNSDFALYQEWLAEGNEPKIII